MKRCGFNLSNASKLTVDSTKLILGRAERISWADAKDTLKDIKLWVHYVTYLCAGCGVTSFSSFSPVIVASLGYSGLKAQQAQLFTAPPYAVAYVATISFKPSKT
jgi:hypothetical protein